MVLSKDDLLKALQSEVHILLHLASKVDPAMLDFRPTPKQRSTLELLRYLAILAPIHLRGVLASSFDIENWRSMWQNGEDSVKNMSLEGIKDSIGQHTALFAEMLGPLTDADFREEIELFGSKGSRGAMLVNLVLCHYVAYRMQLFLYLKASGQETLNTINLWVGRDNL